MSNRRQRQRDNRGKGRLEVRLDTRNSFGAVDKTPREAVRQLIAKQKAVR